MTAPISAVDLFCGAGGLTRGLLNGGIRVVAGVDLDANCRYPYEANNDAAFVECDVRALKPETVEGLFLPGTFRLLAGCAPCQPFSTYGRKEGRDRRDSKWDLLLEFGRLVRSIQPDLVTMENVPQLPQHSIFPVFLGCLRGYDVWHEVVECADFGVPQTRKRLVLLASRLGRVRMVNGTASSEPRTVRSAIEDLQPLVAGGSDPGDNLHSACSLSSLNIRRIRASRPGGSWRDWPTALRAACHGRISGSTYPSVYGRMEWDAPAPTITTQCFGYGNGRFGHPAQDRAITLREAAILQTFPTDYKFVPPGGRVRFNVLGRLIGNAVPVRLGEAVARSLQLHVTSRVPASSERW